ncbi:MAG: T9SS type A sorting domain-containing protein [Muribaculaceae bacterium]|nr:T9SS type A sorting domain-containing protein [Muribaculaceae bacterium]
MIYHSDIVSESTEIFLNPIPSGIYILWIDINGKTQSYKLIKQ